MVIDTSALVAILLAEPTAPALLRAIERDDVRLVASPTRLEAGIVMQGRRGEAGRREVRELISEVQAIDVDFDRTLAEIAIAASAEFGKGNHRARLNFGDCFTYAVAKQAGEPILCVGDDFARTDVAVVPLDE